MSAVAIVQAVQGILQAALPTANVLLGIPRVVNDPAVLYLYHQGYSDGKPFTGGNIRRTHTINLHLLLLTAADDDEAELELMDYNDTVADLFYTNHTLNGTALTADLHEQAVSGGNAPAFVVYNGVEYRHRWWTLDAQEQRAYVMQ